MGKIKWSFLKYIPICVIMAYLGAYVIGMGTNHLQNWYMKEYSLPRESGYEIFTDEDGNIHYSFYQTNYFVSDNVGHQIVYGIISYAQLILIPAWVFFCIWLACTMFYKREIEKSLKTLFFISEKIQQNCLDFEIQVPARNELGQLCQSFEDMRAALYQNNQEVWRMLEDRKRLNAAFSHDMRTPITVLKGYTDLLEKYVPDGQISEEKLLEVLGMMSGQIDRLENYTQKMSALQKLEDITPQPEEVEWNSLVEECQGIGTMLLEVSQQSRLQIVYQERTQKEKIIIDEDLILEVYENLLSNAIRYAKSKVQICIRTAEELLEIIVEDDGGGFSEEALRQAVNPFYREEKELKNHFGLGLYICKVLCEKNQGALLLENGGSGGRVTARFRIFQK